MHLNLTRRRYYQRNGYFHFLTLIITKCGGRVASPHDIGTPSSGSSPALQTWPLRPASLKIHLQIFSQGICQTDIFFLDIT